MELLLLLIIKYSVLFGVDPDLAISIAQHESQLDHSRIGGLGEIGIFQLRPEYFPKDAYKLEKNIKYGIKYLKLMQRTCPHKENLSWIICYNLGVTGASRVKHPTLFPYYRKVYALFRERKRASRFYSIQ